jgi:hypothetical protein
MRAADIYHLKAEHLTRLARQIKDPALRLEMLRTAGSFRRLSRYAFGDNGAVNGLASALGANSPR